MPRLLLTLLLIGAVALGISGTRPPTIGGIGTPPGEFSAARAMAHLAHFADRPHPIGSTANDRARGYLVSVLRSLGASVRVEETTGVHLGDRTVWAGQARNIIATFHGRKTGQPILLMAHYDSVPQGPGAADDGAGVISALEVARAVRAAPPLPNDFVILLTDGEEAGLLGASGYVADHPRLAREFGLVVNLEARGSSGPAMMFETSAGNGALISEFARAAPYPMASSLMYSVYKLLPNDTDLTAFRPTGVASLNFAFTEGYEDYHSRLDTAGRLDPRSVQHLGMNGLGLVRHFGLLTQPPPVSPDCIYFNWIGQKLLFYPVWVSWVLAALTFALLLAAFLTGRRNGTLRWSWRALGLFFLLLVVVSGGTLLPWGALVWLRGATLLAGDTPANLLLLAGLVLAGVGAGGTILGLTNARLGPRLQTAGMLVVVSLLATLVLYLLPGASYLLQWPALLGAAGLLLGFHARSSVGLALWGLLPALPSLLILATLGYLFFVGLDLNAFALLANAFLFSLLLAVAWPLFAYLFQPLRRVTGLLALAAFILLVAGVVLSHPSAQHPRRDSLFYSLNPALGKAKWIGNNPTTDQWTSHFLGKSPATVAEPDFTLGSSVPRLSADAPAIDLPPPSAVKTAERMENGIRVLQLHLQSARGAIGLYLTLPNDADLRGVAWNGRSVAVVPGGKGRWLMTYQALPAAGADLELRLGKSGPISFWLGDSTPGLPPLPDGSRLVRPAEFMAGYGSDRTQVVRSYTY